MTIPTATLSPDTLEQYERRVTVQYKTPDVGEFEIRQVEELYSQNVPLIQITRRLQARRAHCRKPPLIYMDLYSILYVGLTNHRIRQRALPDYELTINDFVALFRRWKLGGSLPECLQEIREAELPKVQDFARQVFRSISDRYRREKRNRQDNTTAAIVLAASENYDASIMKYAQRRQVMDAGEKKEAIVIFIKDLPLDFIAKLQSLPNGIIYAAGVKSPEDVVDSLTKPSTTKPGPITPGDQDLPELDPDNQADAKAAELGELATLERQANRRLRQPKEPAALPVTTAAPTPAAALADEDDLEQLLASMGQRSPRLPADDTDDDTDVPPAPGLSLDNLGDDD